MITVTKHGQELLERQKAVYDAGYEAGFAKAIEMAAELDLYALWVDAEVIENVRQAIRAIRPPQEGE